MVAILFEGKSDSYILSEICQFYNLPITGKLDFYDFKGKDNIFNISHSYYDEIEKEIKDLAKIEKILIIVDADNDDDPNPNRGFKASKIKLEETIANLNFPIPVNYYIMCNENKEGNLESFLLSVLDKNQLECIANFRKCYTYSLSDKWAYNTFYKQKKYPFDFNHQNFDLLKEKLQWLFE